MEAPRIHPEIHPSQSLASLAVARASASRVFHRHGLDFCCNGQISLESACAGKGLDVEALMVELVAEERQAEGGDRWEEAPLEDLLEHLLANFHEAHREELPRLIEMACQVEQAHGDKAACPRHLSEHLTRMLEELEAHMEKEEQVLFPLIAAGRGSMAAMPIQVMECEHKDHGANLERLRDLASDYRAPEQACGTWRALYLGLEELEFDLMRHIHLENNVLFPRALQGST